MKKIIFFTALLFLIILKSESVLISAEALTLEDCIKIGLDKSKTLQMSKSKIDYSKAKSKESDAALLPTLKFNGGYTRLSPVDPFIINMPISPTQTLSINISPSILNNYTMRLSAQQPLFSGFRLESASNINELNTEASVVDLTRDQMNLVCDIKTAFWTYYKSEEFLKSIIENITQIKAHLSDVESFYKNGTATENDVLKVKVQLSSTELLKMDAENNVKLATMALNNTLGIPINSETKIKSNPLFSASNLPKLENMIDEAVRNRPEIQSFELRQKIGEQGIRLARSGYLPQLNLSANFNYNNPNQRIQPPQDAFKATWDVGVNLSYDIWNWQIAAHQTEQALAQLEQTNIGMSQMKDGIILEVSSSYLNLKKSEEKIKVSEEARKQAEENARVTKEKYNAGLAINSDVLDADNALLQSKITYTTSVVDFEIAKAKLDKSVGK